jgi:hypothetical protein
MRLSRALDRQLIVFPRYSFDENRAKLAVVNQGVVEAARFITPGIVNFLQFRGGFEEKHRFEVARVSRFPAIFP